MNAASNTLLLLVLLLWHPLMVLILLRLAFPPKFAPPESYRVYMRASAEALAWQRAEYERGRA